MPCAGGGVVISENDLPNLIKPCDHEWVTGVEVYTPMETHQLYKELGKDAKYGLPELFYYLLGKYGEGEGVCVREGDIFCAACRVRLSAVELSDA